MQPDITGNEELASKLVIEFLQGLDKSKPFSSVQAAKNVISHVNVNILKPAKLSYKENLGMVALDKWLVRLKKDICARHHLRTRASHTARISGSRCIHPERA